MTVTVEVDYLLRARVSTHAARAFMTDVDAGRYIVATVDAAVFARARELDRRHADLGLGLVDASVVAVAEDLAASTIATLDAEHFSVAVGGRWPLVP